MVPFTMRTGLLLLFLATLMLGCGANIQIRVRNHTTEDYTALKVGLEDFGTVTQGTLTSYRSFREGSFDVTAGGKKLGNLVFQTMGSAELTPRFFTLFISNGPYLYLRDDLNAR